MKHKLCAATPATAFLCTSSAFAAPRIAIWNPVKGTSESRVTIDLPLIRSAAASLEKSGAAVSLLTAEDLADGTPSPLPDSMRCSSLETDSRVR